MKHGSGTTTRPGAAAADGTEPLCEAHSSVLHARERMASAPHGAEAELARALSLLSDRLAAAGHFPQAAIHAAQRVELLRRMAREARVCDGDLAAALHDLGARQVAARQPRAAQQTRAMAITLWQRLTEADSARWSPTLVARMTQYADFNARIGERAEQLRLLRDATAVARGLARLDPRRNRPVLRQALRKLARELVYLVPTADEAAEARALRREARGLTLAVWRDRCGRGDAALLRQNWMDGLPRAFGTGRGH